MLVKTRVVVAEKLRGGTRLLPFLLLLGLVVYSVSALAAGMEGPSEPPPGDARLIWGAAALQIALTLVGGMLLFWLQRSSAMQDSRMDLLEKRAERLEERTGDGRCDVVRIEASIKRMDDQIASVETKVDATAARVDHMGGKIDRLLEIMGAHRV